VQPTADATRSAARTSQGAPEVRPQLWEVLAKIRAYLQGAALVIPAGVGVGASVLDECLSCQTSLFEVRALRSAFLSAPP
jgi:hypothetical protein